MSSVKVLKRREIVKACKSSPTIILKKELKMKKKIMQTTETLRKYLV